MPVAPTRWIKRLAEFQPKEEEDLVPTSDIRGRLRSHRRSRTKSAPWSHFSVFEVWDNVSEPEIKELEGLFRHIYRRDSKANRLNMQKTHRPLRKVRLKDLGAWKQG